MTWITDLETLHSHYGTPKAPALKKVAPLITPAARRFIEAARFCLISSVGPEGTDGSPRGDRDPVVRVAAPDLLLLPDWQGNDRIDTLRNIIRDGRVSLYFMVPGSSTSLRINGEARISVDAALRESFLREGKNPRSVIAVRVREAYIQCARAIQRSDLWAVDAELAKGLPSVGEFLQEASHGEIDGAHYDAERATRAHLGWW